MRIFVLLLLLASPTAAGAQVSVTTLSNISFGDIIGGMAVEIVATDPGAAGFEITAPRNSTVDVSFVLPAALDGAAGATLPLSFNGDSGGWSTVDQNQNATLFDPRVGVQLTFASVRQAYVWLGGRVTPTPGQPAGAYTGTVTISAARN
ncbi:MAG TPA: DUF4402 domain-containing protein [Longimicrobiales bacterium]|nr:DUF4402 domain-containing protein [Longimicrobiales bacterium]